MNLMCLQHFILQILDELIMRWCEGQHSDFVEISELCSQNKQSTCLEAVCVIVEICKHI